MFKMGYHKDGYTELLTLYGYKVDGFIKDGYAGLKLMR